MNEAPKWSGGGRCARAEQSEKKVRKISDVAQGRTSGAWLRYRAWKDAKGPGVDKRARVRARVRVWERSGDLVRRQRSTRGVCLEMVHVCLCAHASLGDFAPAESAVITGKRPLTSCGG